MAPPSVTSVEPLDSVTVTLAVSLSVMLATTLAMETPSYPPPLALWVIVPVCPPSTMASFTAVTVTVCGVLQSPVVNVSVGSLTLTSASGLTVMVTVPEGTASRTTSYESVAPPSVISVDPADSVTVTLGAAEVVS